MKLAYYNEIDPYAAEWLRNLISAGHIAPGEVDTRSIKDVTPDDVRGFTQCHFFAGVGGWSLALRLAGWPDSRPVWTGSCPCQPFSDAGLGRGEEDERHLWPEFRRLVTECHPAIAFGEQVASKAGKIWLSRVRLDLEALGYGVGAADLCAACAGEEGEGWIVRDGIYEVERVVIGAPHIRQRLFWGARELAEPKCIGIRGERFGATGTTASRMQGTNGQREWVRLDTRPSDAVVARPLGFSPSERDRQDADAGSDCPSKGEGRQRGAGGSGASGELGDAGASRLPLSECGELPGAEQLDEGRTALQPGGSSWSDFDIIPCLDGKSRRAQSSAFPLAHGIPRDMGRGRSKLERMAIRAARANRTGRLKGYGNAIVPELAAQFIAAFLEC